MCHCVCFHHPVLECLSEVKPVEIHFTVKNKLRRLSAPPGETISLALYILSTRVVN